MCRNRALAEGQDGHHQTSITLFTLATHTLSDKHIWIQSQGLMSISDLVIHSSVCLCPDTTKSGQTGKWRVRGTFETLSLLLTCRKCIMGNHFLVCNLWPLRYRIPDCCYLLCKCDECWCKHRCMGPVKWRHYTIFLVTFTCPKRHYYP